MHSAGGNHPGEKIPSNQDEFGWRKLSLRESFIKTGCIWPAEIIPARKFCQIRMNSAGGNHPCYEVTIVKRRLQEISVSGKPHLYFSDSVWKEL